MNYKIATLGCKVNQFETQALETMLREHGFMINVPRGEYAYTIIDTDTDIGNEIPGTIGSLSDVIRIRVL